MAELTISEARKIYSESDSMKDLMLSKFTKEELEKHEVTQSEFDKKFIELLGKCTKTVFITDNGFESDLLTNRIEFRDKYDYRLLDIQFTGKNKHFWVSYYSIWKIFEDDYLLGSNDIKQLMKNQMHIRFGLDDVIPRAIFYAYRVS